MEELNELFDIVINDKARENGIYLNNKSRQAIKTLAFNKLVQLVMSQISVEEINQEFGTYLGQDE